MNIAKTIKQLQETITEYRNNQQKIALVPTMGGLHQGHLELIKVAKLAADKVIVTIFVNPLQFNQTQDFETYPRTEELDIEQLKAYSADVLFIPSVEEIYPNDHTDMIDAGDLAQGLCGQYRPGHFDGVATVIVLLFRLATPDIAVFGQKDYQQLCIIKDIVKRFEFDVEIIGMPTFRTSQGLAMSSRNVRLDNQQIQQANNLYKVLSNMAQRIQSNDMVTTILNDARKQLECIEGIQVEYLEVRKANTLQTVTEFHHRPLVILAAIWVGDTRLIDNVVIE